MLTRTTTTTELGASSDPQSREHAEKLEKEIELLKYVFTFSLPLSSCCLFSIPFPLLSRVSSFFLVSPLSSLTLSPSHTERRMHN